MTTSTPKEALSEHVFRHFRRQTFEYDFNILSATNFCYRPSRSKLQRMLIKIVVDNVFKRPEKW